MAEIRTLKDGDVQVLPRTVSDAVSMKNGNSAEVEINSKADKQLKNLENPQLALFNLGGMPHRNLLRNAFFIGGGSQKGTGIFPINQKGQTEYTYPTKNIAIDGWALWGAASIVQLTDDGLIVGKKADGSNTYVVFEQVVDEAITEGSQLTASVLLDNNELYTVTVAPGWTYSGEATLGVTYYRNEGIQIRATADKHIAVRLYWGSAIELGKTSLHKAVSLEYGDKQTIAYKDANEQWQLIQTPDFGTELAKCQRRLYIPALSTLSTFYPVVVNPTSGDIFFPVTIPVPMRVVPSFTAIQLTLYVGSEQKAVAASSVTCYALRGNQALCRANGVATGISSKTGMIEIGGLQLIAEL